MTRPSGDAGVVVTETPLPGIGIRYEFVTQDGDRIGVVHHRSGIRELVRYEARGEFSIVVAGIAVAEGAEPELGPIAAVYVLLLAICGPLAARFVDRRTSARAAAG